MIESTPFSINPLTGSVTTFHYDHATDEFHLETTVDLQPFIDLARAAYNESRSDWKGDLHHVAAIPMILLPELEKQGIMTSGGRILDEAKLKAWLNDADNRAFRTRPGRV